MNTQHLVTITEAVSGVAEVGHHIKYLSSENELKMEDECVYYKFDFCKYEEKCRNHHQQEECEHLSACKSSKRCPKRHPKVCRRFTSYKGCRYERQDCVYHHPEKLKSTGKDEINEKIETMAVLMNQMSLKINNLEPEIKTMKKKNGTKVKYMVTIAEKSEETEILQNDQEETSTTTRLAVEDKDKSEIMFQCDLCSYKCKKEITLKRHLHTKHENQKYKTYKLTNSMELVMHVAMEHSTSIQDDIIKPRGKHDKAN